jgi:hypothetical protein
MITRTCAVADGAAGLGAIEDSDPAGHPPMLKVTGRLKPNWDSNSTASVVIDPERTNQVPGTGARLKSGWSSSTAME